MKNVSRKKVCGKGVGLNRQEKGISTLNRRKAAPRSKKARICFTKNREIRYERAVRKKRNQEIENSV